MTRSGTKRPGLIRRFQAICVIEGRSCEEAARQAIENDVHVIGVSSQAAGHKTLVPQLIEALRAEGAEEILVVCGGVIPPQHYDFLMRAGAAAIYGPGTNIPAAAAEIMTLLQNARAAAAE